MHNNKPIQFSAIQWALTKSSFWPTVTTRMSLTHSWAKIMFSMIRKNTTTLVLIGLKSWNLVLQTSPVVSYGLIIIGYYLKIIVISLALQPYWYICFSHESISRFVQRNYSVVGEFLLFVYPDWYAWSPAFFFLTNSDCSFRKTHI